MNAPTKALIFIVLLIISWACSKDERQTTGAIPYIEVNLTIDLDDPKNQELNKIGGWAYIAGGSRGIILYRINNEEFKAYERQCPYDAVAVCSTVDVDPFTLQINDNDCCGSTYNITSGAVFQGPAFNPLKQYGAYFQGATTVLIKNI